MNLKTFKITFLSVIASSVLFGDSGRFENTTSNIELDLKQAKSIYTNKEKLVELSNSNNPFILKALASNPKFIEINDNKELEIINNRNVFDIKLNSIITYIDNIKQELLNIANAFHNKQFDFNKNYKEWEIIVEEDLRLKKAKLENDLKVFEKNINFELQSVTDKFNNVKSNLEEQESKINTSFNSYVKLEKKKIDTHIEQINLDTKNKEQQLVEISLLLHSINKSILIIKEQHITEDLKNTLNPELKDFVDLFEKHINKVSYQAKNILKMRQNILQKIEETKLILLKDKEQLSVYEKVQPLKERFIQAQFDRKIAQLKLEKEQAIYKAQNDYLNLKSELFAKINSNEVKLQQHIKNYKLLEIKNYKVKDEIIKTKNLSNNYNEIKDLIIEKETEFRKLADYEYTDVNDLLHIASNYGTPIDVLEGLAYSKYWSVREAVATNIHTPLHTLLLLKDDSNKFVSLRATKNLNDNHKNWDKEEK